MNKITGSSLWTSSGNTCSNCGMAKDKSHGCCHDECRQVKLCGDQQLSGAGYTAKSFFSVNGLTPAWAPVSKSDVSSAVFPKAHYHNAMARSRDLFKAYCVWRI